MTNEQQDPLKEIAGLRQQLREACARAAAVPMQYHTGKLLLKGNDQVNGSDLKVWMDEMVEWGKRVRLDIRRLEECCCLSAGDPGDPPQPPE